MGKVLVTGSSGLIGVEVCAALAGRGDGVVRLRRDPGSVLWWDPIEGVAHGEMAPVDAVINLAGEPLTEGRWSARRKESMRLSRVAGTRNLVRLVAEADHRPDVLVSISAVGYYGDGGERVLTEMDDPGQGYLADLCAEWEEAALEATRHGIRVVVLRMGMVVTEKGGALDGMLGPFRMGAGGWLGSGSQWVSWVSLDDAVSSILFALDRQLSGVYNVVSPNPVTNREFAELLADALSRAAPVSIPPLAARLVVGDMVDEVGLKSQRVSPEKIEEAGFRFAHPDLGALLERELAS